MLSDYNQHSRECVVSCHFSCCCVSILFCQCSVWVVSGPAFNSNITVIDPARSNRVLDQFSLPPTAPALCICAVPPTGQCQYDELHNSFSVISTRMISSRHADHWNTSPFLFTQAFLSCSVRWRCRNCMDWNSGRKVVSVESTAHFIKRLSHLFFPLSSSDCLCLTVYLYTRPLLAGETVCSQFPSQKVFIHSRELLPLCVMFLF